jgi:hypothetical protein
MTEEQRQRISEIPEFLRGEMYDVVTVLYFSTRLNDMFIRSILDPLMFLFQELQNNTQFKINFNPTEEQKPMLRRFMEMAQGRLLDGLPYHPLHKYLPP